MLLFEFFNTPEDDSYAKSTTTSGVKKSHRKIAETTQHNKANTQLVNKTGSANNKVTKDK